MLPLYSVSHYSFTVSLASKARLCPLRSRNSWLLITAVSLSAVLISSICWTQEPLLYSSTPASQSLHCSLCCRRLLTCCFFHVSILMSPAHRDFSILIPNHITAPPTFLCFVFSLSHPYLIYTYFKSWK